MTMSRVYPHVAAVIPCLDEEEAIGSCVTAVQSLGISEVIVVDGGSADRTAERAATAGARVVIERDRGYGRAMMAGIGALSPQTSVVLFIDGDGSDRPEMIPAVLEPIESGRADLRRPSPMSPPCSFVAARPSCAFVKRERCRIR